MIYFALNCVENKYVQNTPLSVADDEEIKPAICDMEGHSKHCKF